MGLQWSGDKVWKERIEKKGAEMKRRESEDGPRESQERTERKGAEMKRRGPRMAPGKVRRKGLCCLLLVRLVALFFFV